MMMAKMMNASLDTMDMPAIAASPYTPAATFSISVAMLASA